jgi:arylsulfatase
VSDNGASGEGGPTGSVNEMKFANGVPDDLQENLAKIDDLGSEKTYNHYPNGWAMAFNTPFKMWKRYEFNGGTSDPFILAWPGGKGAGELREQYCHAIDIAPTILDLLGIDAPTTIKGHTQNAFDGRSIRSTIDDADEPSPRSTQFYAMLGSRSIWHDGWKAVTNHPTLAGWGHFNDDEWELYHVEIDRSEVHNLAADNPDKVRELVNLWFAEAGANGAFPLDDRSALEILNTERPQLTAPRDRYVYFPGTAPVPEWQAVTTRGRSFVIGALVDVTEPHAEGVLFALGTRFGGHALYVKDNRLHYLNNFLGIEEQKVVATADLPTGEKLILSASFEKTAQEPDHTAGTLSLYYGDEKVGEGQIKTQLGAFAIAGSGLYVGRHEGEPLTADLPGAAPHQFTGGTINRVAIDVSGDAYLDLEREAELMLMRE